MVILRVRGCQVIHKFHLFTKHYVDTEQPVIKLHVLLKLIDTRSLHLHLLVNSNGLLIVIKHVMLERIV